MSLPNRSGLPADILDHANGCIYPVNCTPSGMQIFPDGNTGMWINRLYLTVKSCQFHSAQIFFLTPWRKIILQELSMLPRVILHTAMSLDGRITNFPADLELYYTLAARWNPDAILFGSETVLAACRQDPSMEVPKEHEEIFTPPENSDPDPRPLLVIADSRGRVRCWDAIQKWPYMRGLLALCSFSTPKEYLSYLAEKKVGTIITGDDRIEMRSALEALNAQYGVKVVRVDSGGTLNSVLLDYGLVDEVSVLIHPFLTGGKPDPTIFDPLKAAISSLSIPLKLCHSEVLEQGIIWARYIPLKQS
jgi:2,5-diamino-6-(ribosylamino)-4(3H)-pyrimidinone 5'-phosphate reductase